MVATVEELREFRALFEQVEQTPHHEAGHAVVMAWLKLPFTDSTMEEEEGETAGQVTLLPGTYRRDYTDSAIGCAAGQAADNLHEEFCGNPSVEWDNSNDNNQIRILGMLAECLTTEDQRGWFNYVRRYAELILRIPYVWAAVEELAKRSVELGGCEISAQEATTILLACKNANASGIPTGYSLRSELGYPSLDNYWHKLGMHGPTRWPLAPRRK
jgi:hypothetical protein